MKIKKKEFYILIIISSVIFCLLGSYYFTIGNMNKALASLSGALALFFYSFTFIPYYIRDVKDEGGED